MSQTPSDPNPLPPQPVQYATRSTLAQFNWPDFWSFRAMITVPLIKILFGVMLVVVILVGLGMLIMGVASLGDGGAGLLVGGLLWLLLGPIFVRVYCEILIVVFRINETLTEIKHVLESRP